MSGFKNFIMRGNLVQLAVAVVIGAQFSALGCTVGRTLGCPLPAPLL
jgi:large-conductance mechanosensitive channel